jgi:tetratricopeptide (TPR) repeat protein
LNRKPVYLLTITLSIVFGILGCLIASSLALALSAGDIGYYNQYVDATVSQSNSSSIVSKLIQNGNALLKTSEYDKAMTTFDQVLKLDFRSVDALNGKGLVLNNLGKYQEAILWFDKALKIDPNFVDALYNKADALGELGNYEEAFIWTEKALAIDTANQNTSMSTSALLPNEIN